VRNRTLRPMILMLVGIVDDGRLRIFSCIVTVR
jgi:hypothetical protein